MKRIVPILLFIVLYCSGNSLPLEKQAAFFVATPVATGGGGGGSFPTGADVNWQLDGDLTDASGNSHTAAMVTGTAGYTTGQDGTASHAFDFTSGSRIFAASDASVGNYPTTDFSISFWFNAASFSGTPVVIAKGQFNTFGYYLQFVASGSTAELDVNLNPAAFKQVKTANTVFSLNTWYHVVFVNSGGTGKIYVNGSDATSSAQAFGNLVTNASIPLRVGDYVSGGFPFNGRVDEITLWPRALTSTEVANVYALNAR